jgi:hypothetical protein
MRLSQGNFIGDFLGIGNGFKVCLFKDNKHKPDAPAHFHIIISLCNNENLVVCLITSQVENVAEMYDRKQELLDSMIPVDDYFNFLNRLSIADCNASEYLTVKELQRRIDFNHVDGFQVKAVDVNIKDKLKKEIINAILNSPIVKNHIKAYIKAAYLP